VLKIPYFLTFPRLSYILWLQIDFYQDRRAKRRRRNLRTYTAVIEKCPDTGLFVGYIPGMRGAHSQGETLDELNRNLKEVVELLLEDGEPELEAEFVGTQSVVVA
jgi:predicted RNase H-like HicB family nuclease